MNMIGFGAITIHASRAFHVFGTFVIGSPLTGRGDTMAIPMSGCSVPRVNNKPRYWPGRETVEITVVKNPPDKKALEAALLKGFNSMRMMVMRVLRS